MKATTLNNQEVELKSDCCNAAVEVREALIGGFPGHEHMHPGGYIFICKECKQRCQTDLYEKLRTGQRIKIHESD